MKKAIDILKVVYWTTVGVTALIGMCESIRKIKAEHKEERIRKMKEDCIDIEGTE